jgi:hypothetical protein
MLKIERLVNDPSYRLQLSNRHIVALCNLSIQVGVQGRIEFGRGGARSRVTSTIRLDLTADPDAIVECANAGLALLDKGYVTVSPIVQEALAEWLDTIVCPASASAQTD